MIRIASGEFRTRILQAPRDESISRPYGSRVKESVFNLLRGWCEGASVLDLFAGVGTMGLEALSRGASRVVMVEKNRAIFKLLQRNIEMLNCGDRAAAIHGDALSSTALIAAARPVDLIFIDPPYELMREQESRQKVLQQAARCRNLMGDRGFLVLRSPIGAEEVDLAIAGFDGPEVHRYATDMHVLLYAPAAKEAKLDAHLSAEMPDHHES